MDPNEKLLSFSRFQIGLSKADLQPSSGVCLTRTQPGPETFSRTLLNSRTVVGQIVLLLQPSVLYGLAAGCIIWKLPHAFASKSGHNFLPMMLFILNTSKL